MTIIVLIILATISTYALLGYNGLIGKAEEAKELHEEKVAEENKELIEIFEEEPEGPTPILSYVGYYADIEGNGTIDGIIFADLRKGNTGSGEWGNSHGTYTIPTIGSSKEYYVKEANSPGSFGDRPVIAPVEGTTGADRFYIMALSDVSSSPYYWYYNAYGQISDYAMKTSTSFGSGSENTTKMLEAWNAENPPYGTPMTTPGGDDNAVDMWRQVADDWFIPSKEEWSAFAGELGIDSSNYNSSTNNLSHVYWSSSLYYTCYAWGVYFGVGHMIYSDINSGYYSVRLATTF